MRRGVEKCRAVAAPVCVDRNREGVSVCLESVSASQDPVAAADPALPL